MASAEYSVPTPERVSLQYDIAGVGSRGRRRCSTRYCRVSCVLVAIALGRRGDRPALRFIAGEGSVIFLIAVYVLATFLVTAGLHPVRNHLERRRCARLLGVRVIRENGYPIRPVDAVIRNLVHVDWLPRTTPSACWRCC
jgi:hypothetical protein